MGLNNMMNEQKIKDIADECFSCIPDHHELRNFTELIVKECAKQCLTDDSMRILNHMGVNGVE